MIELSLLGVSSDGESILLVDRDGTEYSTPIDGDLITAVRRTPKVVPEVEDKPKKLSPRDIQTLLREGLSAEQIFAETGTPVERVRRYERPVLAEINHAILEATETQVGSAVDSPTMGDLVVDRLASDGIDTEELSWSAHKNPSGRWEVAAYFEVEGTGQNARWELLPSGLHAKNKRAKALTETTQDDFEPVRAFFPMSTPSEPKVIDEVEADIRKQEELVERLNSLRGKKQPIMEDFEGEGDLESDDDAPPADKEPRPPKQEEQRGADAGGRTRPDPARRQGRKPVPSWDEIVFGRGSD